MTDLLPCPFCGEQPRSEWCGVHAGVPEDGGYWAIECCSVFIHTDEEEDAVHDWNTRSVMPSEPQEASDPITAEDTFRATLRVIAHWAEVDLSGEWETGLRGVIRSMTDAAREALSAYPSSPVSRPHQPQGE